MAHSSEQIPKQDKTTDTTLTITISITISQAQGAKSQTRYRFNRNAQEWFTGGPHEEGDGRRPNRQKSRRKKGFWAQKSQPEIANRQRLSIAPLNRNAALLSLVSEIAAISGVRDGHRNRKSQKSLRFRRAKNEKEAFLEPAKAARNRAFPK